jgi:hypothetical protein
VPIISRMSSFPTRRRTTWTMNPRTLLRVRRRPFKTVLHDGDIDTRVQDIADVQEYISGQVHKTPTKRTMRPQTRNRKIHDEENYWDPITVSDVEETPQKSAGQPARGRRLTKRPRRTSRPGSWRGASLQRKIQVSGADWRSYINTIRALCVR